MKKRLLDTPFTSSLINDSDYVLEPIKRGLSEIMPLYKIQTMFPSVFIAGGYARYCLSTRRKPFEANDLDLFVLDSKEMPELIEFFQRYTPFTESVVTRGGATVSLYHQLRHTEFVSSSKKDRVFYGAVNLRVQINLSKFNTLKELLDNFDMRVAQFALIDEEYGICHSRGLEDDVTGILTFIRDDDVYLRMKRILKYVKKGYTLPLVEVEKLFTHYNSLSRSEKIASYMQAVESADWYPVIGEPPIVQAEHPVPTVRNIERAVF